MSGMSGRKARSRRKRLPLGFRLLLIVLLAVALPLALTGVWLTRDAGRAGEELLRARMGRSLDDLAGETARRWVRIRAQMLDVSEDRRTRGLLGHAGQGPTSLDSDPAEGLIEDHSALGEFVHHALLTDLGGTIVARLSWDADPGRSGIPVAVEVRAPGSGELLGHLEAHLRADALLGGWTERTAGTGGVVGVLSPDSEEPLLTGPFDPAYLTADRFHLGGEEWITGRRRLSSPPVMLVLASPLEPFTLPFREAARRGVFLILAVGVAGFALAALLTVETTRSMQELADAAESVARGDLQARVRVGGPEEVARAGRAFNAMASNLQRTLDALAKREALAAVGEFAASLAHELRNPLTAIRLDLQRIDEVSGDEARQAVLTDRMLAAVRQLDRTVGGVLRVAGSGRAVPRPVPLGAPLSAAARTALPSFEARGARLELPSPDGLPIVEGDEAALEQLFLNLLVNAAEALDRGGLATVGLREDRRNGRVVVVIRDTGPGLSELLLERALEPLFTTKAGGTGLGLAIARRIARAHGGELRLRNGAGGGAVAEVELPGSTTATAE